MKTLQRTTCAAQTWLFALRGFAVLILIGCLLALSSAQAQAQTPPTLIQQVISRQVSIHVGGAQTPEHKEIVSREFSVFVGEESNPPHKQVASREVSIVVTTPAWPAPVANLSVTPTPTGESVTLSWAGYNEWAQNDVASYAIYMSTRPFTNVSEMTPVAWVQGETFTLTRTNLSAWQDRFFAVVPVDALKGYNPEVNYAAGYAIAREVASREFSVFVGDEPSPPYKEVASREVSIVVTTPAWPAPVANLAVTPTPTGESVTLSWAGYNEWAQNDVVGYAIYMSMHPFTNVSEMTPAEWVPGETFTLTRTNLSAWQDRFFAVVPVDALNGYNPSVNYAAAYVIAREVASREFSVFVGDEANPPYKQVASRDVSIVVSTPDAPAPVTCLSCGFMARDSVNSFSSLDLDWTAYNEVGQQDVARYRIYLGPAYFEDVSALSPYMYVSAETKGCTVPGLNPYGIYYVAVVAEDVAGQINSVVRSQSAQASVDRVREVRNLAVSCGTNSLTFTWQPPEGADPYANNLLAAYNVYFAGAATPVALDRFVLSYTATNLLMGHGYPMLITTVDNSNRESGGASLLAATLVKNPEQTVAHSFYSITRVAWERVQPEEVIAGFKVYESEADFTSVAGMMPARTTRGHSCDFINLTVGKTYYFAVTTVNIAGSESANLPIHTVAFTPTGENRPIVLQAGSYRDGVFTIQVDGPVGADYVLQGSTNLTDWVRMSTNSAPVLPYDLSVTNMFDTSHFFRVLIE